MPEKKYCTSFEQKIALSSWTVSQAHQINSSAIEREAFSFNNEFGCSALHLDFNFRVYERPGHR